MITNEDIEIYLDECGFTYVRLEQGLWKVDVPEDRVKDIVVTHIPPLVVIEVRLMQLPAEADVGFYRRLLEANVKEITHGAFGIEEDYLVLTDTLLSESLDLNELKAAIQSLSFAVVQYYKEFAGLVKK